MQYFCRINTRTCLEETNADFFRVFAADGKPKIIVCWMHGVVQPWIKLHLRITSIPVVQPSMKKVGGFLWLWNTTDVVLIQQLTTPRPLNVTYTRLFFLLFSLKGAMTCWLLTQLIRPLIKSCNSGWNIFVNVRKCVKI